MKAENIISEIHRFRENLARSYGYDVKKIMDHYRQRECESVAKGRQLVSFIEPVGIGKSASVLYEEPSKK